jgi:hypothetical protein
VSVVQLCALSLLIFYIYIYFSLNKNVCYSVLCASNFFFLLLSAHIV